MPYKEGVLHDLGLLLDAVAGEGFARLSDIIVAAEGVAHQREPPSAFVRRLPDMGHLVDEMGLGVQIRAAEAVSIMGSFRVEPEMAVGGHGDAARLEGPPFAAVDADFVIIDRVAEDAGGEDAFGLGEGTGGHAL